MRKIVPAVFFLALMAAFVFPAYAEKGKLRDCMSKYKGMPENIRCCYEHHQDEIEECQLECQRSKCESYSACETVSFDMDCGPVVRR